MSNNTNAVVYLLNNNQKDIFNFRQSISLLIQNYYQQFNCDIICFYEPDFPESELQNLSKNLSDINIEFHKIVFSIPDYPKAILDSIPEYFPHPDFPQALGFSIGYRHMCRFFAGAMFSHPVVNKYKYIWRLDTDSFIVDPVNYNVFDKLKDNGAIYGYINIQHDHPGVIKDLWENSYEYFKIINKTEIFEPKNILFHWNRVFYTNFEVFDVEWFTGNEYQNYFNFIDNLAGIYKYRWGDHSIRYIGVNSLASPEQIHFYDDIRYFHQNEYFNTRILDTFNAN